MLWIKILLKIKARKRIAYSCLASHTLLSSVSCCLCTSAAPARNASCWNCSSMSNADGLEKCRKENDPHSLMLRLSVCLFCTYTHSMLAFIFFAALRDQRYKLIHYSKDELSIQLSNVTVHDEGVYKCFYYGIPFKSKNKTVKVLGKFFHPLCPCFSTPDLPFCMQLHGAFTFLILVLAQSFPPPPNNAMYAASHKTQ